jgi:hypothetical protein
MFKNIPRDLAVHELIHLLSDIKTRTSVIGADSGHEFSTNPYSLGAFDIMQPGVSGFNSNISRKDILSIRERFNLDIKKIDLSMFEGFGEMNLDKPRTRKANGGYINIPKFETGINSVPADMIAMLHKNEAVIPANMNPFNPNASNGVTINTSITVGSISNEIDFDALIKKNNDDIIKKMKMNGLVSKVGR